MKKDKFYLYYFILYLLTVIITIQINYLNPLQVMRSKAYDFNAYYFSRIIIIFLIFALFYLVPLLLGYWFKKSYFLWQITYLVLICGYLFIENTFFASEKWRGLFLEPIFWQDSWYLAVAIVAVATVVSIPISLGSAHIGKKN